MQGTSNMISARGQSLVLVFLLFLLVAAAKPTGKASLVFVVDTSKSMEADVRRFATWAAEVLPLKKSVLTKRFDHFAVTTFNAIATHQAVDTQKAEALIQTLKMLKTDDSTVCQRMILPAVQNVAKIVKPGSVVLVLTNGMPRNPKMAAGVVKIAKDHGIRLIFAMTGCCNKAGCKFKVLGEIAKASKGVVYRIGLADVQQIVKMISEGGYEKKGLPTTYSDVLKKNLEKNKGKVTPMLQPLYKDKNFKFMTSFCDIKENRKPSARFTRGCTVFQCTKDGLHVVEERCDANQDGWDCRIVSDVWKCTNKGVTSKCTCIQDKRGVLIKID